jgi:hypothetical protein
MEGIDNKKDEESEDGEQRISSYNLAALIVDALLDAKIVKKEDVARALEIATEEIEVRTALGDY